MITKEVYKYAIQKEVEGNLVEGFTISTDKPNNVDYTVEGFRLIAENGMVLINSGYTAEDLIKVIDAQSKEGWSEVEEPIVEIEEDLSPEGDLYREFLASRGISNPTEVM